MFVTDGEKLGSILVDPSSSDPIERRAKRAKAETAADAPAVEPEPIVEPTPEPVDETPEVPSEPTEAEVVKPSPKKAPAKKAPAFKSALDT